MNLCPSEFTIVHTLQTVISRSSVRSIVDRRAGDSRRVDRRSSGLWEGAVATAAVETVMIEEAASEVSSGGL